MGVGTLLQSTEVLEKRETVRLCFSEAKAPVGMKNGLDYYKVIYYFLVTISSSKGQLVGNFQK